MTWQALSVSPKDAEMLASRQFSIQQIARMCRLPPPLLGDLSGGNFSSLVELGRWFASHCIAPWCTRWERPDTHADTSQWKIAKPLQLPQLEALGPDHTICDFLVAMIEGSASGD